MESVRSEVLSTTTDRAEEATKGEEVTEGAEECEWVGISDSTRATNERTRTKRDHAMDGAILS